MNRQECDWTERNLYLVPPSAGTLSLAHVDHVVRDGRVVRVQRRRPRDVHRAGGEGVHQRAPRRVARRCKKKHHKLAKKREILRRMTS